MNRQLGNSKTAAALLAVLLAGCMPAGVRVSDSDASATVSVADQYVRAERWLPGNARSLVRNIFVTPHWIAGTDDFWYRRETAGGHEFLVVDAASGEKRAAFDHGAIATALHGVTGKNPAAARLPFRRFEFTQDGAAIRFSVRRYDYQCELAPASCKDITRAPPPGALVSPDGRKAVRTVDGNLILVDIESGAEEPLTVDGKRDFGYGIYYDGWKAAYIPRLRRGDTLKPMETQWDPGSRYVAVPRVDQRHVARYPIVESVREDGGFRPRLFQPRLPLTGEEPAKLDWFIVDTKLNRSVRIDLPYENLIALHQDLTAVRRFTWSEDGTRLFAVTVGRGMQSAQVFSVDVRTGRSRVLVSEIAKPRMDLNSTPYNPPNVAIVDDGAEVVWWSQRDGWGHLYLYDGASGTLKNRITAGNWLVRDLVHVDESARMVYFTGAGREAGNPYYRYLYRASLDGGPVTLLSPEPADHMITGIGNDILAADGARGHAVVSPGGGYVVYNYSTVAEPTRTVIRTTAAAELVAVVENADTTALYEAGWRNPQEFMVKAADGETDLYGVLYPPAALDQSGSYPIVDSQYVNPLFAVAPRNFMMAINGIPGLLPAATLPELGFAVVVLDGRGTAFRSAAFARYANGRLNTMGLEDHIAGIRQLADRYPWLDAGRVGIHGASYGGWTTLRAMLEYPDFFNVGIMSAGMGSVYDMYPDFHWELFEGPPVYSNGSNLRPTPASKPANYAGIDGPAQVERLRGKLLIMLGETDENVPAAATLRLIDALIREDKDFDMLYLPSQPHNFAGPHTWRRGWDYFVRHLAGREPPKGYRIGGN